MSADLLEQLKTALLEAARLTFTQLQTEHSDEHFYVFALFTNEEASYICEACNTLEGLTAQARVSFDKDIDKIHTLESWQNGLRWSPGDFKFFCKGYLRQPTEIYDLLMRRGRVFELCIEVMQQLDREGFFGTGEERAQLTLMVFRGREYPQQRFERAKLINPDVVMQRMAREIELESKYIEEYLAWQQEKYGQK